MTPAEILPDLTVDELLEVEHWLDRLPVSSVPTIRMSHMLFDIGCFLHELAYLRRQP